MKTTLTTFDGFPRSDIDVPQSTGAAYPHQIYANVAGQFGQLVRGSYA
jgi:hypothetical protein